MFDGDGGDKTKAALYEYKTRCLVEDEGGLERCEKQNMVTFAKTMVSDKYEESCAKPAKNINQ